MRLFILLAGAALVAFSPAALAQGKGHGQGHGGGDSAGERGGGKGRGGGSQGVERRGGGDGGRHTQGGGRGTERRAHGPDREARGPDRRPHGQGGFDRGGGKGRSEMARGPDRPDRGRGGPRQEVREHQRGRDFDRGRGPDKVGRVAFVSGERHRRGRVFEDGRYRWNGDAVSGWCPPGLARKGNGCMPPGQARKLVGPAGFYRYSSWYDDAIRYDWRYWNGYGYRMDPLTGLIVATLPLLGGALYGGHPWPVDYPYYDVDPYYDRYYGYGPYDYRYASGTLFAVDPTTAAIVSIAALLTGDDWVIGRPMPIGYSMYNVPLSYRARYYDTPDSWYRYSDGYIYRVEPRTMIVRETIVLL